MSAWAPHPLGAGALHRGEVTAVVRVTLTVGQPHELAERYYPNGKLGGLAVDGKAPGPLGLRVELTVRVKKPARSFEVMGQLAWARHKAPRGQSAAFGVDFLPEDDATRVRLLAFARNEVNAEATRLEQRLQVELPVRLVHRGTTRREFLADLSSGGAFVRTWDPLQPGEQVELSVRPPLSFFGLTLKGRVAWARTTGAHPGMGIEFDDKGLEARDRVEKLLAKLARS
ncbi:MAG: PilZ domain-containing protein [Myxococcota bacterium]